MNLIGQGEGSGQGRDEGGGGGGRLLSDFTFLSSSPYENIKRGMYSG